ncbi:hydroxyquinol 1,2-dioxygenase (plasmid) [Skermanella sp. TT6]|uniref:Hydroxyquinol 1,2-dioxygenase n=2 Tax=Skermanella cutis TaxID=2775420 RepID=A0ABX7BG58_9PROT|nr:hydroxyquinol 1,2-dioxygenase [Skermanella sp. TT6]
MTDLDGNSLTREVIDRFADTGDPRLKAVIASLVRHLHGFVQDVELTVEEWGAALEFLARAGRACTEGRQEFVLLSDVLGVTMLVDSINHPTAGGTTETAPPGPFHAADAPELPLGADMARGQPGERLHVEGSVSSGDGRPLANAVVDVWQADENGYYDMQRPELTEPTLRARFRADGRGRFAFRSILPSHYPIPAGGPVGELLNATGRHPFRPAHIHFRIAAEGYETLVTQLFPADGPYLADDAAFGVKPSLVVACPQGAPGDAPDGSAGPWRRLAYDFVLKAQASASSVQKGAGRHVCGEGTSAGEVVLGHAHMPTIVGLADKNHADESTQVDQARENDIRG